MRTSEQRNDAYVAGVPPTTVGLKIAARLPGMKSGFASAIQSLVPVEISIQNVLNGQPGTPTIQYPFYLCFGREIWALTARGIDGPNFAAMAQSKKDKWQAAGLDPSILIEIADEVFHVAVT